MAIASNKGGTRIVPEDADDAFWDCEALKLDLMGSEWFKKYARGIAGGDWAGDLGLTDLKFRADQWSAHHGRMLIEACMRMYDARSLRRPR